MADEEMLLSLCAASVVAVFMKRERKKDEKIGKCAVEKTTLSYILHSLGRVA